MKRLLAVFAGGLGLGALLRRHRRKSVVPLAPVEPVVEAEPDALAEELRAKLAESRAAEAEAPAEPAPVQDELDARRREIHERARGSIDELGDV